MYTGEVKSCVYPDRKVVEGILTVNVYGNLPGPSFPNDTRDAVVQAAIDAADSYGATWENFHMVAYRKGVKDGMERHEAVFII
jgi:hypothetical protein